MIKDMLELLFTLCDITSSYNFFRVVKINYNALKYGDMAGMRGRPSSI